MTIDCNIYLPSDTRLDDICDVIGILIGHEKELGTLDKDLIYCSVKDIQSKYDREAKENPKENIFVSPTYTPDYWLIIIKKNPLDNVSHQGSFFFEEKSGMRLIKGGSNDFWIKIGKELVKFFGGYVDYDDCDKIEKDFEQERPRKTNYVIDGEEWNTFEKEKYNIKAIKKSDLKKNI